VNHAKWGHYSFGIRDEVYDALERSIEYESKDRWMRMESWD